MGFGLNIIDKPLEIDTTDWVNYNDIMMPKMVAAGKKAAEKRTENFKKNHIIEKI